MGVKKKSATIFRIVAAAFAVLLVVSAVMLVRELRQSKMEAQTFSELAALRLPRKETSAQSSTATKSTATPTATAIESGPAEPIQIEIADFSGEQPKEPEGEMPVEETPAAEVPTEETQVAETPVEDTPTDETPDEPVPLDVGEKLGAALPLDEPLALPPTFGADVTGAVVGCAI